MTPGTQDELTVPEARTTLATEERHNVIPPDNEHEDAMPILSEENEHDTQPRDQERLIPQSMDMSSMMQAMFNFFREERREERAAQRALERDREETRRAEARAREEESARRVTERELDRRLRETPPFPAMKEADDIEIYLCDFIRHVMDLQIPKMRWLTCLRPLLCSWARRTVDMMSDDDRSDFDKVKRELLRAFANEKGSLGHRIVTSHRQKGQRFSHFLNEQWKQWTEGLTLIEAGHRVLIEMAIEDLPYACRNHVREKEPTTVLEMSGLVEKFFSDRNSYIDDPKWYGGGRHHTQDKNMKAREKLPSSRQPTNPSQHHEEGQQERRPTKPAHSDRWKDQGKDRDRDRDRERQLECYNCHKRGHIAARCPDKTAQVHKIGKDASMTIAGRVGDKETTLVLDSGASMSMFPPQFIEPQQYTGQRMRVKGAVGEGSLPTANVIVQAGGEKAQLQVLVQKSLTRPLLGMDFPAYWEITQQVVNQHLMTKKAKFPNTERIDGEMTMVEEEMDTSLAAEAEDVAMPSGTDDEGVVAEPVVINEVKTRAQRQRERLLQQEDDQASEQSGATPTDLSALDEALFTTSKVKHKMTRSQKRLQARERLDRAGKTEPGQLIDFAPKELEEAQRNDITLTDLWNSTGTKMGDFFTRDGILRRHHTDDWGDDAAQVVVPTAHRREVLMLSHNSPLAAHLGYKKTLEKVLRGFWWPGVEHDVKAYCQTCADCQKGSKGNKHKAPLMPLPAVDEPFRRIAVDVVGPVRRSKRGNKYILTLMDFATRFPEAVALRRVDAQTVADALMSVFCRLGFPEEILTDQGSNFMSGVMKKVMELLGVHQLKTSPYHPQCDGMLERFHSTLKLMLRKTCVNRDRWDDYLPYACFAFRDSVHSAT